jgi:hypothetical protein
MPKTSSLGIFGDLAVVAHFRANVIAFFDLRAYNAVNSQKELFRVITHHVPTL